jgi:hypothetical protein
MSKRKKVTVAQFLAFAAEHEKDHWETRDAKAEFRYQVKIKFIPSSRTKRKKRRVSPNANSPNLDEIAEFLEDAQRTGSTTQSHYRAKTASASYLLAVWLRMTEPR